MTVTATGDGQYELLAQLTDTSSHGVGLDDHGVSGGCVIHDFTVEGLLEGPDLVVSRLVLGAQTHPYQQCPTILPACESLVGTSLLRQWRATVLQSHGGIAGCTHVTTLLLGLAEARTAVFFLRMNEREEYSPQTRTDGRWTAAGLEVAPSIVDACHVLNGGGQAIRLGRRAAMERPSSTRLLEIADDPPDAIQKPPPA